MLVLFYPDFAQMATNSSNRPKIEQSVSHAKKPGVGHGTFPASPSRSLLILLRLFRQSKAEV
jgi:hypothetical protein